MYLLLLKENAPYNLAPIDLVHVFFFYVKQKYMQNVECGKICILQ